MKKKVIALLLAVTMVIGMTACGGGDNAGSTNGTESNGNASADNAAGDEGTDDADGN